MKKSLILTFVFAAISFTGAFAQKISRPTQTTPAQEQKNDKATPSDANPGSRTPSTNPSGQNKVENRKKGENQGKHVGDGKNHKKSKTQKGTRTENEGQEGKEKHERHMEGEGHDHKKDGQGQDGRMKDKPKTPGRTPAEAPKNEKSNK